MGFDLTHVYGLTEVYGPATVCKRSLGRWTWANAPASTPARACPAWSATPWRARPDADDATRAAGRRNHGRDHVPGNIAMKGYLKNPKATDEAFAGGWFHTGDLAVQYPDGYVKIKDRSKDIIISGGENISSIEVETCSTAILPCWPPPWWPNPTLKMGRDALRLHRTEGRRPDHA